MRDLIRGRDVVYGAHVTEYYFGHVTPTAKIPQLEASRMFKVKP